MKFARALLGSLGLALVAPLGCTSDGLIGGDCADGYAYCGDECISVTDDYQNCGECNLLCGRNLECVDGVCGGPDGTEMRPGTGGDGGGGFGGEGPDGSGGGGGINVGAGGPGGNDGTGASGNTGGSGPVCIPPYNTQERCGECTTSCEGSTPNCAPDGGGGFECVENCETAPYVTRCSGECVDLETDARHCGSCNNVCPSGICVSGDCIGATSGHMVAMCMSYERQSISQTQLLANAVFLAPGSPVRVLAYVRNTSSASRTGTDYALDQAAVYKGRAYERTNVTGLSAIANQLTRSDYEVLLVYDQQDAPPGELATIAANSSAAIDTFTQAGGVVVVLSGGEGTGEMDEFLSDLSILSSTDTTNRDGLRIHIQAPGDAVGINIVSPFRGVQSSCAFVGAEPPASDLIYVASDTEVTMGTGEPVVTHRIIAP